MKEDILEQVVDEYLQHRGYFTIHNLRFKPDAAHRDFVSNQDSVTSDVDVVGFNPKLRGHDRVWVVSCKSWQTGFDTKAQMKASTSPERVLREDRRGDGREALHLLDRSHEAERGRVHLHEQHTHRREPSRKPDELPDAPADVDGGSRDH
jgi:hypothetical protein